MNFTVSTVAQSLAAYLAPLLPGVTMYEDPNQQGTTCPCMFLQQRYSYISRETGTDWYLRRIGLDLTYLLDYNVPNQQRQYEAAAEALDLALETFPYMDGSGDPAQLVRAYEREWRIDLNELHYKFELRERVFIPREEVKMQTMDYNEEVLN
ncbi:MAG TPA: hypothetical protein IAC21_06720 [Candidatus Enterenecus merdae]|nr:hypothetical protein [Candidatus Enterenecus merdae]